MIGGSYKCPSPHQEQYSKLLSWHSPSHLRRGCPSDHDLKSGQICAAEKMKLDVVSDPSRSGTDRNRAGMREVHGGASTVAAHARGGGGARLSQ